ncbi:hypothetical protein [Janthinobacterium sp.]|uniref:hypothetical protein n=1 Tax=Janthinobacterium sp. TaxID=1871054 RepID=UPI00293D513F|nr:hypothetical protein [Janthinobacterium sp.]
MSAAINAQHFAERRQAHADFLTARQRDSGMRVRRCSTGCFSLYSAAGHFIGRTAQALDDTDGAPTISRAAAVAMAFSTEMASALRLLDIDFEMTGTVGSDTVAQIRRVLDQMGVA